MKILVTGAAGCIGSHLCDELIALGHEVLGVDNLSYGDLDNLRAVDLDPNFEFRKIDVGNIDLSFDHLDRWKTFNVIFHLASYKKPYGQIDPNIGLEENVEMSAAIKRLADYTGARVIFTSTSDVYGNSTTFQEDDKISIGPPTNPRYSYAMSKLYCEQLFLNSQLKVSIARVFGCSSPRAKKDWSGGHIPLFIKQAMNNEDITIHGDGLQTRSICHAKDIVKGLVMILNKPVSTEHQIINIGTDEQTTVLFAAEYIKAELDSSSDIKLIPREEVFGDYEEVEARFANLNKAKDLLGYSPEHTTKQVIDEIIEDYAEKNISVHADRSLAGSA